MQTFKTHKGTLVFGDGLKRALAKVADDYETNARALRLEDPYAPHVTESQKDDALAKSLELAEKIRKGEVESFTVWQRVNYELTGECVAFLPATKESNREGS